MKKLFTVFALVGLFACSGDTPAEKITTDLVANPNTASGSDEIIGMAEMSFEEESFDFGEISQGEKVEHIFKFKNSGEASLIISSAVGSCGCTVPSYPNEPIKPGAEAEIKVVFDSNGKKGAQHKRVTIVANTNPNKTMLAIMGNVLVPETEEN